MLVDRYTTNQYISGLKSLVNDRVIKSLHILHNDVGHHWPKNMYTDFDKILSNEESNVY